MKTGLYSSFTVCVSAWIVFFCSAVSYGQALQMTKLAILPLAKGVPPVDSPKQLPDLREPELISEGQLIDGGAEKIVTDCLQKAAAKEFPGLMLQPNEIAGADELLAYMKKTDALRAHACKLGRNLQASHVLAGTVSRYRQRQGKAYGVEKPATVAFSIFLIDVNTGDAIWSGAFDKTQQSLSENVLNAPDFFKGGAKWLTAEEFACQGAGEIAGRLKDFASGKKAK